MAGVAMSRADQEALMAEFEAAIRRHLASAYYDQSELSLYWWTTDRRDPLAYLEGVWDTIAGGYLRGMHSRTWRGQFQYVWCSV